jgi:hypothetical protein
MPIDATTNFGGKPESDSARSNDLSTDMDDPANLDFSEPTEANGEAEADQGSQGETDEAAQDADQEADATAETEDQDSEEGDEADKPAAKEADDDVVVTIKGGEKVPLKELIIASKPPRWRTKAAPWKISPTVWRQRPPQSQNS